MMASYQPFSSWRAITIRWIWLVGGIPVGV
jgi:hypothetical protein